MKNTDNMSTERAFRYWQSVRGNGDYQAARQTIPLPRFKAKQNKKFCATLRAKRQSRSMMHATHPAGMKPVIQQDDRSKLLFVAYRRRIKARPNAPSFDRVPITTR